MFIEAIDKLRCTRQHEDSWLVAKFVQMSGRDFREGELGCPVCEARYPVREGVVYFSERERATHGRNTPSPDETFELAVILDLSAPERTIVLVGSWSRFAKGLSDISQPRIFSVNGTGEHRGSEQIYEIVSSDAIPLAPDSIDAIALDSDSSEQLAQSAVRSLREAGRLVADANVSVPSEVSVIARDDNKWVAQKSAAFIPLRRANR